jgi:hypothetical protein
MTDCTELRLPRVADERAGEGQEGMPSQLGMTDCTELRLPRVADERAGEGQEGMPSQLGMTEGQEGMRKVGMG